MPDREPYTDAKPVAELLGCSQAYVLRLALLGKIPAYPLPGIRGQGKRPRWRFRLTEVERWMAAQKNGRAR